ncbi:hypothetical protein BC937DRAFT_88583 [Endogone sp. FLAS-F59071]|nr:hypothetical protein BC937DRAFT_88583 [Endogone sp. FLAS-F59071]|eukprot:RUS18593.1 hypothetical protein BC937DRAFT_88583 [Endogone sp. FLAS-F59071]
MVLPPPHIISPPTSYPNQSSPRHTTSLSSSPASSYGRSNYDGGFAAATNSNGVVANAAAVGGQGTKKGVPSGMVMIRDIAPTSPTATRDSLPPVIAHFRPHNHPISLLCFNPAGTLLMTVSSQAHTFQVFSVGSPRSGDTRGVPGTGVSHLYKLSRGYTDAQVEDCRFSADSQWCAVSTARGTTHIYAINPEGGPAEIVGHVKGRARNSVGNLGTETQALSQNAVVRIKQRTPMPNDATTPGAAATNNPDINSMTPQPPSIMASPILGSPFSQPYGIGAAFSPIQSSSPPYNDQIFTSSTAKPPRAKLATAFLEPSRTPYAGTATNGAASTAKPPVVKAKKSPLSGAAATSSVSTPAPAFNQMRRLSPSFTSLLSTTVSAASGVHQRARTWAFSGSDRGAGDRVFGFDEEAGDDPAVEEGSQRRNSESAAEETGYQDLLSFHPGGMLTLHRCWVGIGPTRRREGSRVIESKELIVWEEDVAEWKVVRGAEWEEVKVPMEVGCAAPRKDSDFSKPFHAGTKLRRSNSGSSLNSFISTNGTSLNGAPGTHGGHLWLANAEISTYFANDVPLWQSPQFSFQTYVSEGYQDAVRVGRMPETKRVVIRREVPEPYGSRSGRIAGKGRETLGERGEGGGEDGEENDADAEGALAELQENISKAMQTQLDNGNHPFAPGRSPGVPKRLSSSAGATTGGLTMTKPMMNRVPSHSFEDAYLVNMGSGLTMTSTNVSGYSPPPSIHPAMSPRIHASNESLLIQFDDTGAASFIGGTAGPGDAGIMGLGEDINVFSPDGDNEVEFPSDSVFVGEQAGWKKGSRM